MPQDDQSLVVVKRNPFNAEAPAHALRQTFTPTENFYVRSNFAVPAVATDGWRLQVGGAVEQPLTLTLAELMNAPARTLSSTMECAGNNRLALAPLPKGEPWGGGAISTGVWQGVSLSWLLDAVGLHDNVVELLFEGADAGKVEGGNEAVPFARSLPLDKAHHPDTIVAYQMNGGPLPAAHGGPVRLLVPGWYGMASVKWLTRITALTEPFAGFYQRERYVYDRPGAAVQPVREMLVKSLITYPAAGDVLPPGNVQVTGYAWSGVGAIASVEVSIDGAGAWQPARLLGEAAPYTWQAWEFDWPSPPAGRHVLRSRATDGEGNSQPDVPPWNRLGYGNNAVQLVVFEVAEG